MSKGILVAASAFFLTGCATAQIAQGPSISAIQSRSGEPVVSVETVQYPPGSRQIGTIGAASIQVPDTVKNTVRNYLVNTLYDNFKVSVKPVEQGAKISDGKLVSSRLASITMYSFDAIMQPVDTSIELVLTVSDTQGVSVYQKSYKGVYQERIGMSIIETKTGHLIEDTIRNLMGQIAGDDELKKILETN